MSSLVPDSPDEITAWASILTVLIAAAAAIFAGRQVSEARKAREAQSQPFVVVSVQQSKVTSRALTLAVENIGTTLGTNVSLTFDPPLRTAMWEKTPQFDLNGTVLLNRGFPSMPPGWRIERVLEEAGLRDPSVDDDGYPWSYDVKVTYDDHRGKPQEPLSYVLDFRPLADGGYSEELTTHHLAKYTKEQLTKVTKELAGLNASLRALNQSG